MLYHHRLDLHGCILLQELVSLNRSSVPGRMKSLRNGPVMQKSPESSSSGKICLYLSSREVLLEYTRNIAGRLDDMDIIHPAQLLHIFSILFSDA